MAPFFDTLLQAIAGTGLASCLRRTKWQREVDRCENSQEQRARQSHSKNWWRSATAADIDAAIPLQKIENTTLVPLTVEETPLPDPPKERGFHHVPMFVFPARQLSGLPYYSRPDFKGVKRDKGGVPSATISNEDLEAVRCPSTGYHRAALEFESRLDPKLFEWWRSPAPVRNGPPVRSVRVAERRKQDQKLVLVEGEEVENAVESDGEREEEEGVLPVVMKVEKPVCGGEKFIAVGDEGKGKENSPRNDSGVDGVA